MGRTVLPFSMVLAEQQQRLSQFRRTLRKQDQELFDELFERARFIVEHAEAPSKATEDGEAEIPF